MLGQLEQRPSDRQLTLIFPELCGHPQAVGSRHGVSLSSGEV